MTPLKTFNQFILESKQTARMFVPQYFNLPYSIPEDRFSEGLLKNNPARKSKKVREILQTDSKYTSQAEFFIKNPVDKVEKELLAEINRVVKFIASNPLTGKKTKPYFSQNLSLKEYLDVREEEDAFFGTIETELPFSTFSIRVDYDVYKNIPVFTFWYGDDLFYYYGIFTLEANDVSGSGENHTYITADEVIDYLFYESVWRAAADEFSQMGTDLASLGFSESDSDRLLNMEINRPAPIVDEYFDKRFIRLLKRWIETGDPNPPIGKKTKFNSTMIPATGLMSLPGKPGMLLQMDIGPSSNDYTIRILSMPSEESKYLAIRFNYDDSGITSIESAEYQPFDDWEKVNWQPLAQADVNTLFFIDKGGRPVWFTKFMHS